MGRYGYKEPIRYLEGRGTNTIVDLSFKKTFRPIGEIVGQGAQILGKGAQSVKKFVVGTAIWADAVIAGLDYWNNVDKGYSEGWDGEAWAIAKQTATAGFWKEGDIAYVKELLKIGKEMNFDPTALENTININKKWGELEEFREFKNESLGKLNEKIVEAQESGRTDLAGTPVEEIVRGTYETQKSKYEKKEAAFQEEMDKLISKLGLGLQTTKAGKIYPAYSRYPNLDKIVETELAEGEIMEPYWQLKETALEKLQRRKTEAHPLQSRLVNPESGRVGDWATKNIFNVDAWKREHELFGYWNPTPQMVEEKKLKYLIELAEQGNPEP